MFALSPNYFSSENCLEAWEGFTLSGSSGRRVPAAKNVARIPRRVTLYSGLKKEEEGLKKKWKTKAQDHLNQMHRVTSGRRNSLQRAEWIALPTSGAWARLPSSSNSSMQGIVTELFSICTISSSNSRVKAFRLLLVPVYVYRILCFIPLNHSTSLSAVPAVPTFRET